VPPWTLAALGACLFFAGHYVTLRGASGRIPDAWGGLLVEVAASLGLLVLALLLPTSGVATTRAGVAWSCASGLCITGGVFLLFQSLRLGGPVAGTGTIALGGGVALASLIAPFVFAEAITPRRLVGVALGLAAVVVLATEKAPQGAG
jgi:drug/metabolite transporter (DMT)-like permease